MHFTFWAIGCPFLLIALQMLLGDSHGAPPFGRAIYNLTMLWFWCGLPTAAVYWLVRLVRYAWRDRKA